MQYYRCRCGVSEAYGSMAPYACTRCPKCGSNLALGPEAHREPKPHEFVPTMVETDEGPKPLSRCIYCNRTRGAIEKEEQ